MRRRTEDGYVEQSTLTGVAGDTASMLSVMMELYPTGRSLAKQLPTEYAILQQVKTERELKSQAYLETKKQDANEQLEFDWSELEDIVTGKFGYLSKADMYIKFFAENPSRDDLGDLTINPERASGNYIRITGNDVTFYLNEYKTKGQYGAIKNKLSRELSAANQRVYQNQRTRRWGRAVWQGQDERFRE